MDLTESHVRRLITASVEERRFLRNWYAMTPDGTRDHDLIVILDALNERALRLAGERQAEAENRERVAQREKERFVAAQRATLS
jgi:hypothetical protein